MSKESVVEELGADLILVNGKVVTVDPKETIAEAIAVRNGKILWVGSRQQIKALAKSSAKVIDLEGERSSPGSWTATSTSYGRG
jgi:predicted amidohydrolase YtcJ